MSFKDLKNQLKFIGIEYVDEMFAAFIGTAFRHTNDQCVPKKGLRGAYGDERVFGHFMFLLRCIMIRHTQAQKYRGTTTSLMSLPPKVGNWKLEEWLCNFYPVSRLASVLPPGGEVGGGRLHCR
jgi:hypothetical protein